MIIYEDLTPIQKQVLAKRAKYECIKELFDNRDFKDREELTQ